MIKRQTNNQSPMFSSWRSTTRLRNFGIVQGERGFDQMIITKRIRGARGVAARLARLVLLEDVLCRLLEPVCGVVDDIVDS